MYCNHIRVKYSVQVRCGFKQTILARIRRGRDLPQTSIPRPLSGTQKRFHSMEIFSRIKNLSSSFYVPDSKMYDILLWLLLPVFLGTFFSYFCWKSRNSNRQSLGRVGHEFCEKYLKCTLGNLESGKLWTLVTGAVLQNASPIEFFVLLCGMILYGGNVFLSFGARTFYWVYGLGHVSCATTSAAISFYQLCKVRNALNEDPELNHHQEVVEYSRKRLKEIKTNMSESEIQEAFIKAIDGLTNKEILLLSARRYRERESSVSGGLYAVIGLFALANPLARLRWKPLKGLLVIPSISFAFIFFLFEGRDLRYKKWETWIPILVALVVPAIFWRSSRINYKPVVWNPYKRDGRTVGMYKVGGVVSKLSEKKMELMKKRNEKFVSNKPPTKF
eukprot:TRINITY_DN5776_c1_g1_i3.p1 TRINITY_DN5776_c1_g1~~TRINITY_DN5776_c1_g1_i3.p1  ORF type:complete len:414 (-),score=63.34 TRINITY_DN5776_c1_g1_i3:142-1308(-)